MKPDLKTILTELLRDAGFRTYQELAIIDEIIGLQRELEISSYEDFLLKQEEHYNNIARFSKLGNDVLTPIRKLGTEFENDFFPAFVKPMQHGSQDVIYVENQHDFARRTQGRRKETYFVQEAILPQTCVEGTLGNGVQPIYSDVRAIAQIIERPRKENKFQISAAALRFHTKSPLTGAKYGGKFVPITGPGTKRNYRSPRRQLITFYQELWANPTSDLTKHLGQETLQKPIEESMIYGRGGLPEIGIDLMYGTSISRGSTNLHSPDTPAWYFLEWVSNPGHTPFKVCEQKDPLLQKDRYSAHMWDYGNRHDTAMKSLYLLEQVLTALHAKKE